LLTGFNTDVEYAGVVYHVQTEDKGLRTPFILSLVYTGGAILASKRSPYDDLIALGFDEGVLAQRLARQHKLICAAVHAGRIEDLKRLGERDVVDKSSSPAEAAAHNVLVDAPAAALPTEKLATQESLASKDQTVAKDQVANSERFLDEEPLTVSLLDEDELRAGTAVTLRLLVSRAAGARREPARQARLVVKTLGSTFRPRIVSSTTNNEGIASIRVSLPLFDTGRAAILVRVDIDGLSAELRRIILPAESA
jgi:hypothetical protein